MFLIEDLFFFYWYLFDQKYPFFLPESINIWTSLTWLTFLRCLINSNYTQRLKISPTLAIIIETLTSEPTIQFPTWPDVATKAVIITPTLARTAIIV